MHLRVPVAFAPFLLTTAVLAQSNWSPPVFEAALNSTASDAGPHLSFDGLTPRGAPTRSPPPLDCQQHGCRRWPRRFPFRRAGTASWPRR